LLQSRLLFQTYKWREDREFRRRKGGLFGERRRRGLQGQGILSHGMFGEKRIEELHLIQAELFVSKSKNKKS